MRNIIKEALWFLGAISCDREEYETAFSWFRKAAEAGVTHAFQTVGDMYHDGIGIGKDEELDVIWHKRAAEVGAADSEKKM